VKSSGHHMPAKKPSNLNTVIHRKSLELFKRIRDSQQWQVLEQIGQYPEFKQAFESLNTIERNVRDYKYASTHQMSNDLFKWIQVLIKLCKPHVDT